MTDAVLDAYLKLEEIPIGQLASRGQRIQDLVVDRGADVGGEASVSLERGCDPGTADEGTRDVVDARRRNAGTDLRLDLPQQDIQQPREELIVLDQIVDRPVPRQFL